LQDDNHVRDPYQGTTQHVPVQKVKKGRPQPSDKDIHSGIGTRLNQDVAPAKQARLKVRSSAKKKVTFGKEWEAFMKEHIREDNELNLRVIRYEVGCRLIGDRFLILDHNCLVAGGF
jgi:hypothetical protein